MHWSYSSPRDGSPGMVREFQIEGKICPMYGALAHGKSPFMGSMSHLKVLMVMPEVPDNIPKL